jgi:hypothetical protein
MTRLTSGAEAGAGHDQATLTEKETEGNGALNQGHVSRGTVTGTAVAGPEVPPGQTQMALPRKDLDSTPCMTTGAMHQLPGAIGHPCAVHAMLCGRLAYL